MMEVQGTSSLPKSFLDLPAELREQIYKLLLVKPQQTITMLLDYGCYSSEDSALQPSLTRVNRLIRSEALPLFYNCNTFSAQLDNSSDLEIAKRWVEAIGDTNIGGLGTLSLTGWTKVISGHMMQRQWAKATIDMQAGTIEIAERDAKKVDYERRVVRLEAAFNAARGTFSYQGCRFDAGKLMMLMDRFALLCSSW